MWQIVEPHPDKIALLGVRPDRAESGYGYIAPGRAFGAEGGAWHVAAFHEKPAPHLAARVMRRGGLWNSFVMVGRVTRILARLREVRPDDVAGLERLPAAPDALACPYDRLRPWNFSRDFLARIPEHLVVVRADDLGWSDWGTPEAIERTLAALGMAPPWRVPLQASA